MTEQLFSVDVLGHPRTQTRVAVAELSVHPVKGVRHGINCIHHELNLPFLLITGIPTNFFQTFNRNK